jgi:hypothetical protein
VARAAQDMLDRVEKLEQVVRNPVLFRPAFHDDARRQPGNLVGIIFCSGCGRPYDLQLHCRVPDEATRATVSCPGCGHATEVTTREVAPHAGDSPEE